MVPLPAAMVLFLVIGAPNVQGVKVASSKEGDCGCLPWNDVYKLHNVECGAAKELSVVGHMPRFIAKKLVGEEFCRKFFERLEANFCVSTKFNHADATEEQFCYVSSKCQSLGGGKNVNQQISWKTCSPEADEMLARKVPTELLSISEKVDKDLGLMAKFSWQVPKKWSALSDAEKSEAKASGKTLMYDSDNGHPPFRVVSGGAVYKIDFRSPPDGMQAYAENRMGKVNGLTCESGCK